MAHNNALSGSTRLADLLAAYPWLREALAGISKKFMLLQTPLGKMMADKATISEMSKRSGIEEAALIRTLETLIAERTLSSK